MIPFVILSLSYDLVWLKRTLWRGESVILNGSPQRAFGLPGSERLVMSQDDSNLYSGDPWAVWLAG